MILFSGQAVQTPSDRRRIYLPSFHAHNTQRVVAAAAGKRFCSHENKVSKQPGCKSLITQDKLIKHIVLTTCFGAIINTIKFKRPTKVTIHVLFTRISNLHHTIFSETYWTGIRTLLSRMTPSLKQEIEF